MYMFSLTFWPIHKSYTNFRAICGRIEDTLQGLPPPFLLNRPSMYKITSLEVRQPQKAPNFAVIWCVGLKVPEIVNTTIGKPEEGVSFVSKRNIAGRFVKLYRELPSVTGEKKKFMTYIEAKEMAIQYNVSKTYVFHILLGMVHYHINRFSSRDVFSLFPN